METISLSLDTVTNYADNTVYECPDCGEDNPVGYREAGDESQCEICGKVIKFTE